MSDIRKDFYPMPEHYNEPYDKRSFMAGFEAGRAHDIEGLIAEIKYASVNINGVPLASPTTIEAIIRKHFGKE